MSRKIIVASGKGGVGKSTVAAGLCRAFCALGSRVLVIDADIGLRSLDLIFGVQDSVVFDWGDLLDKRCKFRQAALDVGGAMLLAAPLKYPASSLKEDRLRRMVESFEKDFDVIIIDAPAGIGSGFKAAAFMANEAVLVSTPDLVCVRSCEIAATELFDMGITEQRLVINRFNKKAVQKSLLLNLDSVIDGCCVRLLGVVPDNARLMFSYPKGIDVPKHNDAKKAFVRIAKRLNGDDIELKL